MKKFIITAGGTSERIDNVRKITNSSSGKLGMLIADCLLKERNDILIYYVCSKNSLRPSDDRVHVLEVEGTLDLKNTLEDLLLSNEINYFIHSMAVSDYMTDFVTNLSNIKESITKSSNIDEAFIITSLKKPNFSDNLLDKLLIICEINGINPIICLTKKDLLTKKEWKKLKKVINYYKKLGYKVVYNNQISKIKKMFKNKTTVFTGQTGAGKSTLMNRLDKNLNFETNEISEALGRGKHTTRYVTLVPLNKGKVLDTPGFSALDLSEYNDEDIRDAFVEFKKNKCKYKNCMHINEKECKVKKEVGKTILSSRYENYKKLLEKR